ncbi:MAG: sigma-54 dependent transcriptional regulator [Pseudomonadota bacterium]
MNHSSVLIVEDDLSLREALSDTLSLAGYKPISASNGEDALAKVNQIRPDLIVSDIQMEGMNGHELLQAVRKKHSQLPFVMMTAYGNVNSAVTAMQEGASEYVEKPFAPKLLLKLVDKYVGRVEKLETPMLTPIAEDLRSVELYRLAVKVAKSDVTVLLTGPSGAGKEIMAKYIHENSYRANKPFVAINCAAIPENMLEAILFGYEKGAFTGAIQANPGKFELAQSGTLLLDEISEMDLDLQAKLLRVLQEKEVERIGSKKTLQLDVRVIATSNRLLQDEVAAGRFREDLYYRLNVFPLACLSLIERRDDIVPIAESLINKHASMRKIVSPVLSNEAKQQLKAYDWPGNVRELENVVQRALILHSGNVIEAKDLHLKFEPIFLKEPSTISELHTTQSSLQSKPNTLVNHVKEHEFQLILETLRRHNGNRKKVSDELKISPRTLRYKLSKMRQLGIDIP